MIPWFVVDIVGAMARPFGWQVVVRATFGRRGADRLWLVRAGGTGPTQTI